MKKLTALLVAAIFSLSAAIPASAAQYDESLAMVPAPAPDPAPKAIKSAKKHKKVRAAKHRNVRKAKSKQVKARAHKRLLRH
jgi:hypothetical protein